MPKQDYYWSKAAEGYEKEFVDPYHPDGKNPLLPALQKLASPRKTVADLGCGIGPLLPFLAEHFGQVLAVDFAEGMLARARQHCRAMTNIAYHQCDLTRLNVLDVQVDVAVAINSLVMPSVQDQDLVLRHIHDLLRPGGVFLAIVPAIDAVHYHTMLLLDRALASGKPIDAARKNAAYQAEHEHFDFAFGQFRYKGLEQHFWQPFEIRHRCKKAGFRQTRLKKVVLPWNYFSCGKDLRQFEPPWDWFVQAVRAGT